VPAPCGTFAEMEELQFPGNACKPGAAIIDNDLIFEPVPKLRAGRPVCGCGQTSPAAGYGRACRGLL
jgi:hypothetical protein